MKKYMIICFIIGYMIIFSARLIVAKQGCCSYHGGVCGCRCCDGSELSEKCKPYYPSCEEETTVSSECNCDVLNDLIDELEKYISDMRIKIEEYEKIINDFEVESKKDNIIDDNLETDNNLISDKIGCFIIGTNIF